MFTTGRRFEISLFGKSHGKNVGCIVKGLPIGMKIDQKFLMKRMDIRRPKEPIGTSRREKDEIVFEYGVNDWMIVANEIMITIPNENVDASSYSEFDITPRPGHADLPALIKFDDYSVDGGAQFSGRMTAPLVAVGALAQQYLANEKIRVGAYTKQIYDIIDDKEHTFKEIETSEQYITRSVGKKMDEQMTKCILRAKKEGDSVGGVVSCMVTGLPIGLGGMWFDALDVSIAKMMMSIPGAKGVEFGKGFDITSMKGSQSNDQYCMKEKKITALTNNLGGVCGGISNGMPLTFNVAFKPTPSISKKQRTVNLQKMCDDTVSIKGRHDPCIVPRAVSVVEAMAAITILDQYLS